MSEKDRKVTPEKEEKEGQEESTGELRLGIAVLDGAGFDLRPCVLARVLKLEHDQQSPER